MADFPRAVAMVSLFSDASLPGESRLPWSEHDASASHIVLTEVLAEVSLEALESDTLETILQSMVDCIARRMPVTIASIILLNDARTHFVQEFWSGRVDLELPGGMPWPVSLGVAGRCARKGKAQLIPDVQVDPDYVPGNHVVKSEYLVPIRHRARLHGVLNLESSQTDLFTPKVCAMFDAVARQIAGAVHLARVVDELEVANRKLHRLSMSDGLTGIANRRCLDEQLAMQWQRHAHARQPMTLLMADVDCFKALNDTRGHLVGDECLRAIARMFAQVAEGLDALVARYGGEEIVLLLPNCEADESRHLAELLRQRVQALAIEHPRSPVAPHVTISIGIASRYPDSEQPAESIIEAADHALYTAKSRGRNQVVVAP